MKKILLGKIHADFVSMNEAIEIIINRAKTKQGGYVVTPNVDHIVIAEKNKSLVEAYANAFLSLADGKPIIWMSHIAGYPLLEKVSGSDLIKPLLQRAAEESLRVYFLGSAPGVGKTAAEILCNEILHLKVVGVDSPPMGFNSDPELEKIAREKMLKSTPDLVLFALGAPKQELLMYRWQKNDETIVMIGIGAGLDFISGKVKRAPSWMSHSGLEWLYRLSRDPRRLARRYLVRDIGIFPIFFRMLRTPKSQRVKKYIQETRSN
ncbi:WecB/TagA/CpsF family glycosyltransferase [Spirochaeta isovalerica]|uniref:N-acetylglucosaminyldiphosphoundecaprenol N-acetyl-beta-D-mannosaminyltransferase n=1 Tax=Spirochaeta isovalerica TaxID=150 RepID=A0A841R5Y2_9SPIO|nr:WecB/TagA/CpsF family glycosyltransferase [Spirochaeta isovalerica]MBB6479246.1 N-acetylglucosaminyldiphosphoundecaprenol N-acetyl-beta-D-mannosaminyltransferase [Spirochaeta isovalerica]